MSDLIARLAARTTGAPVATPTASRSLRDVEAEAHEAAGGRPGRSDPPAVSPRRVAEGDAGRAAAAGRTAEPGTVVGARLRLPPTTRTDDPTVREESGTSELPSGPHPASTPDSGPRTAVGVRSETDPRPPVEPPAERGAGTPVAVTETAPSGPVDTARATGHDDDWDADPPRHVAVARPRTEPAHPPGIAEPAPEPIVRVHIGRLEVRATPEPSRRSDRRVTAPTPTVSLSEYLRGRREAP